METLYLKVRKHWFKLLIIAALVGVAALLLSLTGKDPIQLLKDYGYAIIFVWTFLEGETIVIIAGWLSASVGLKPHFIALCAFCGSFASDQVMFSLGKYKGKASLERFPRIAKNMDKAAALFKKYDTVLILGFRFVYGVRNITPIMLGISGVSHKKFFFLNFIGASVWAVTFTYGGLFLGKAFMKAAGKVGHGIFFIIIGVVLLAGLIWFIRARRSVKNAQEIAARNKVQK